jgi:hypothetical protein
MRYILFNRKRLEVRVQPPAGGTHACIRRSTPKGKEAPPTTDRNERSRLVQPPTMNGEAARLRA